jgi:hypothetical protein
VVSLFIIDKVLVGIIEIGSIVYIVIVVFRLFYTKVQTVGQAYILN